MNPVQYVTEAASRMTEDGSAVSRVQLGRFDATVGYQSRFRLRWMATKLHTFTFLAPVDVARELDLRELIDESLAYAKATKGKLRGLQTGVAVIPVLVAAVVEPPARAVAEAAPDRTWAAFARPAVVDVTSSQTYSYGGKQIWGGVYSGWLRERLQVVATP